MDFNTPRRGLPFPMYPPEQETPSDLDPSDGMFVWQPVIGPGSGSQPGIPNPMSVQGPGIDTGTSLVAQLNWKV